METLSASAGITMAHLCVRALESHPRRVAFVFENERWTYAQTAARIYRVARAFRELGVGPGDGIAVLMANCPDSFVVMAATWMIGARYTALNMLSGPQDLRHILEDAEIGVFVHDLAVADRATTAAHGLCRTVLALTGEAGLFTLAQRQSDAPMVLVDTEETIARIGYTGGTTGRPKGVVLSHRVLVQCATMMLAYYEWPDPLRMLLSTPLSHAAGSLALPTLLRGGTVHVLARFDARDLLATVEREAITALYAVPTMITTLLQHPALDGTDLSSLRTVVYGAAPISSATLAEAIRRIGPVFMQHFGQSEAPNTVCMLRKEDHDLARPHLLASCGRPMPGIDFALLDAAGERVATGKPGEICVRGRLVMDGYWKRPEETAKAIRHGWLHTGDVGQLDEEGYVYIVDRIKDMIISGGFNVYPREVEEVLDAHPAVLQSAVIGVPDEIWGEAVKAFVVCREGSTATAADLTSHVRERKGSVHAPKSIDFVSALPQTPVGKIDKKALRLPYWADQTRAVG
ncbi:MAG: acyl-CoA synthetase [Rhizobacter sp.]|nr:acyl-CoA synthetase [Rhizobacter sp.]